MQILNKTIITPIFLISVTAMAATEFDGDVPADIVRQMVSGEIYTDLPDDFPELDLPSQLAVSGSVRNEYSTQAIFTTTLSPEDGSMAIASSLNNAGWLQLPAVEYQPPQNGFINPNAQSSRITSNLDYCHDRYGMFSILPGSVNNGVTSISARVNNMVLRQPGFSCQQQVEQRNFSAERRGGFPFFNANSQYMPRLVLPEEQSPSRFPVMADRIGSSSSGGETETNGMLQSELAPAEVNQHFSEQLIAQGWVLDAEWAGEFTAGGNWTYAPQPDLNFIGVLSIIENIEDVFALKFRLIPRSTNAGQGAGQGGFFRN